jgi:hypothetical protein
MVIDIDSGGNENSQVVILMTIPLLSEHDPKHSREISQRIK